MSFIETCKEVILRPSDFYRKMPTSGGYADPLTFAAISFLIFGLLSALTNILLSSIGYMGEVPGEISGGTYGIGEFGYFIIVLYMILIPIFGIIFLLIDAALLYIIYKILGGTGSYEGTLRFTSYANAVNIIAWIPIIGWIFSLYSIYLYIVGGAIVHNVSMWRSTIAITLDFILITLFIVAIAVAIAFIMIGTSGI
jgi:hypothetical protein